MAKKRLDLALHFLVTCMASEKMGLSECMIISPGASRGVRVCCSRTDLGLCPVVISARPYPCLDGYMVPSLKSESF